MWLSANRIYKDVINLCVVSFNYDIMNLNAVSDNYDVMNVCLVITKM